MTTYNPEFDDYTTDEDITQVGAIAYRLPDGRIVSNIPHHITQDSPTGYAWAYRGDGPNDLALNILEHWLRATNYNGPQAAPNELRRGDCFALTLELQYSLSLDLANAERHRLAIPAEAIRHHIEERQSLPF